MTLDTPSYLTRLEDRKSFPFLNLALFTLTCQQKTMTFFTKRTKVTSIARVRVEIVMVHCSMRTIVVKL